MRNRRIACALLALAFSGLVLGCGSFGGAGPAPGPGSDECLEGDDSHECEESDSG